jgi:hypothetical protein
MKSSRKWLIIRSGTLLFTACAARFTPIPAHPDYLHPADFKFLCGLFGFSLFGVTVVVSGAAKASDRELYRPSWFVNPFKKYQPYIYFDFGAYLALAYGLGLAANNAFASIANWSWEIPVTVGVGGLLGVRAAMLGKRDLLDAADVPNQSPDPTLASGTSVAEQQPRHR